MNRKKAITLFFNRIARPSEYFAGDKITIKAKENEHRLVNEMLGDAGHGKRALDVGCGVGGYFDILLEKGFEVVGFDIAENMIKVCRSRYAERKNVEIVTADVEYLPFIPDSFHLVLCIDTLQYVGEQSRRLALQEMVKLVKPGELLIAEVKNKFCPAFWLNKRHRDALAEVYSIASVTSVLKRSGCTIEVIKGVFWPTFLSPIVVVKARRLTRGDHA